MGLESLRFATFLNALSAPFSVSSASAFFAASRKRLYCAGSSGFWLGVLLGIVDIYTNNCLTKRATDAHSVKEWAGKCIANSNFVDSGIADWLTAFRVRTLTVAHSVVPKLFDT